jgi:hypothetical protein
LASRNRAALAIRIHLLFAESFSEISLSREEIERLSQPSPEGISWIRIAEKIIASLIVSVIGYFGGLFFKRRGQTVGPRHKGLEEFPWTRSLALSPVSIAIALNLLLFLLVVLIPYTVIGRQAGIQWYLFYGVLISVIMLGNLWREFRTGDLLGRERAFQLTYEILGTLNRLVCTEIDQDKDVVLRVGDDVRCNIMIYNKDTDELEIKYTYNMDNPEKDIDRRLRLKAWKGVAGEAFRKREPRFGPVHATPRPTNGEDEWGFTIEDWKNIRDDLQWIWAFPLYLKDDGKPLGTLNIDGTFEIGRSLALELGLIIKGYADILSIVCRQFEPSPTE